VTERLQAAEPPDHAQRDDTGPGDGRQPASDLLRGHLEALLLAVLEDGPLHGYAIIETLRRRSGGALAVPTGTVYPALRRLERVGHLTSEWATIGGRRRRTYRLTAGGLRALAGERSAWRDFTSAIGSVLDPRPSRPIP
jgi:DNA-binding PadR family transcriptional regulator